ncbi:MAG: CsbD family protein [Paralcaligenes sp.]
MNKDQFNERAEQVEGQMERVTGKVAGNKEVEEKGKLQKTVGTVRSSCDDLKENLKDK